MCAREGSAPQSAIRFTSAVRENRIAHVRPLIVSAAELPRIEFGAYSEWVAATIPAAFGTRVKSLIASFDNHASESTSDVEARSFPLLQKLLHPGINGSQYLHEVHSGHIVHVIIQAVGDMLCRSQRRPKELSLPGLNSESSGKESPKLSAHSICATASGTPIGDVMNDSMPADVSISDILHELATRSTGGLRPVVGRAKELEAAGFDGLLGCSVNVKSPERMPVFAVGGLSLRASPPADTADELALTRCTVFRNAASALP